MIAGPLRAVALLASVGVAGCQTAADLRSAPAGSTASGLEALPSNYRQIIVQEIKSSSDYGRGIREPEISNPDMGWGGLINGGRVPSVCVRYKTQGAAMFGYGNMARAFYFPNGRLAAENGNVTAPGWYIMACGNRVFSPFPEIANNI